MYVPIRTAAKHYNVSHQTIRAWADKNEIEFIALPSGHRRYKIRGDGNTAASKAREPEEKPEKVNICYCRVSSNGQKEDLQRQVEHMQRRYPGWIVYTDIGSGLNWKRKGLRTVLRRCLLGDVEKVAVAHKDRLARFGYEIIEYILGQCGVQLLCDYEETHKSRESELVDDILSIVTVFSARIHGGRHCNAGSKSDPSSTTGNCEQVATMDRLLSVDV
jgi:predicted site-specific integrase-resolvase